MEAIKEPVVVAMDGKRPKRLTYQCFRKHCKIRQEEQMCLVCKEKKVYARGMCRNCYTYEMTHKKELGLVG